MKKLFLFCTLIASALSIQACNEYHYDGSHWGHGKWHHDHGHYHKGHYDHGHHYGHWKHPGRPHHDRHNGGHPGGWDRMEMSPAEALSRNYDIKVDSAKKFLDFAEGKNRQNSVSELGVGLTEMAPLTQLEMPSEETIQKMANRLGECPSKVEDLLSDFVTDLRSKDGQN